MNYILFLIIIIIFLFNKLMFFNFYYAMDVNQISEQIKLYMIHDDIEWILKE